MDTQRRVWLAASAILVMGLVPADAGQPLTITVRPKVALAPAYLQVRTIIEADPDNRSLEIVAESADFYSSSQVQLDGARAPRVATFLFRALPTGVYEVTGTLFGTDGRRATTSQTVNVGTPPDAR